MEDTRLLEKVYGNFASFRKRVEHSKILRQLNLLKLVRPSLRMVLAETSLEFAPLGASRFHGAPDLPPDIAWPQHLQFVAQINLAEFPSVDRHFPSEGWLYFFANLTHPEELLGESSHNAVRVFHWSGDAARLSRVTPPTGLEPTDFRVARCQFHPELMLPDIDEDQFDDDEMAEAYYDIRGDLRTVEHPTLHRLLGYAESIHPDDPIEHDSRRLLLQLDSDPHTTGWEWCDHGRLYFTLMPEDFSRQHFSNCQVQMQFH